MDTCELPLSFPPASLLNARYYQGPCNSGVVKLDILTTGTVHLLYNEFGVSAVSAICNPYSMPLPKACNHPQHAPMSERA